jgi:ABC-2 type transport system ATP-binding protein
MIQVNNLTKYYSTFKKDPGFYGALKGLWKRTKIQKVALDNIQLSIEKGERVGLLGANGAGKTTLIKILSGIIPPDAGAISVMGFTPYERNVQFLKRLAIVMGQKAQLWWDLPAMDSYELLACIYEIPSQNWRDKLKKLSQRLGVEHLLTTPIRKLSLGERMKMELIGAFLHSPSVIFLDEPTLGLDVQSQKSVREFILEYHEEHRPTIILTSHYMKDIEALCPRLLMIEQGRLIYDGSSKQISEENAKEKRLQITFKHTQGLANFTASLKLQCHLSPTEKSEISASWNVPKTQLALVMNLLAQDLSIDDFNFSDIELSDLMEQLWFSKSKT